MANSPQKKLPAYGKALMQLRMSGKVPDNSVVVSFGWSLGKAFPRVVIEAGMAPEKYEWRFLAGLDVVIVFLDGEAELIAQLAQEILKVNPRLLQAFNVSSPKTLILKHSDGRLFI